MPSFVDVSITDEVVGAIGYEYVAIPPAPDDSPQHWIQIVSLPFRLAGTPDTQVRVLVRAILADGPPGPETRSAVTEIETTFPATAQDLAGGFSAGSARLIRGKTPSGDMVQAMLPEGAQVSVAPAELEGHPGAYRLLVGGNPVTFTNPELQISAQVILMHHRLFGNTAQTDQTSFRGMRPLVGSATNPRPQPSAVDLQPALGGGFVVDIDKTQSGRAWKPVAGVSGYRIKNSQGQTVMDSSRSAEMVPLNPGETYRVVTYDRNGEGPIREFTVPADGQGPPPPPPANLEKPVAGYFKRVNGRENFGCHLKLAGPQTIARVQVFRADSWGRPIQGPAFDSDVEQIELYPMTEQSTLSETPAALPLSVPGTTNLRIAVLAPPDTVVGDTFWGIKITYGNATHLVLPVRIPVLTALGPPPTTTTMDPTTTTTTTTMGGPPPGGPPTPQNFVYDAALHRFTWSEVPIASHYRLEKYNSGVWTTLDGMISQSPTPVYTYMAQPGEQYRLFASAGEVLSQTPATFTLPGAPGGTGAPGSTTTTTTTTMGGPPPGGPL